MRLRVLAIVCFAGVLPGQAQVADPRLVLTGTIGENNGLTTLFGTDPGYFFQLKEHPGINFLFHTSAIEHEGRYLREGIEGLGVRVQCKKPEAGDEPDTCEVASLTWLTPAPNMTTVTGTITQFTPLARVTMNERGADDGQITAHFRGVRFQLRESPDRDYEFQAPEFLHDGRSLIENLIGARVSLTVFCLAQDPAERRRYCDVGSLRWLPAQP
jgi:hypothetical protein